MAEVALRFGVADPVSKARAATWKLWTYRGTGRSDVYLACRQLGGVVKLSLHESGRWHVAFDRDRFGALFEDGSHPDSRFTSKWERPVPPHSRVINAARIVTPWSSVITPDPDPDSSVTWLPAPPPGYSQEIGVFLGLPGFECSAWPAANNGANLAGALDLEDGGRAWVNYKELPLQVPALPKSGTPRYFKGAGAADLAGTGLRALAWGVSDDGAALFFDAPVEPPPQPVG